MSILIRGMEMPKDGLMIFAIRQDGMVEDVMGCYVGKAVPVPPHGRLIAAFDKDCRHIHIGRDDYYCRYWERWGLTPDGFCSVGAKMDGEA